MQAESAGRLSGWRFFFARRVADYGDAWGDVVGDHAASSDDGVVADGDAGENDGASADPDVASDADRLAGFEVGAAGFGVTGVVGSVDLDGRADLSAVADLDGIDVEEDAVEVEEDAGAEMDVVAVVAEEGRADGGVFAAGGEDFAEEWLMGRGMVRRGVVFVQEGGGVEAFGCEFVVVSDIVLTGQHLLFLCLEWGRHRRLS